MITPTCSGSGAKAEFIKMDLPGEKYKALCPVCHMTMGWVSGGKISGNTLMVVRDHYDTRGD
jgi:hypothetical protein